MINAQKLRRAQQVKGKIIDVIGSDGILSLAKDGICPHYVISNPLTKEEEYYFMNTEINEWFANNCVKYSEGGFTPKFEFYYFDREEYKTKRESNPPLELGKIDDLYELPVSFVRTPPGIYFLCKERKIIYIGQATNISDRILTHHKEATKAFDSIYFITCPVNKLSMIETALIRYLRPEHNVSSMGKVTDKDKLIAESILKNEPSLS